MSKIIPNNPLSSPHIKRKRPNERLAMPRNEMMALMMSGDKDMRKHEPTEEEMKLDRDDAHRVAEAEKEKNARSALDSLESNPADDSEEESRRRAEKKRVVRKLEIARKKTKKRKIEMPKPPISMKKDITDIVERIPRSPEAEDPSLPIAEQVWHFVEPPTSDDPLVHLDRMVCSSEFPKEDRTMIMTKIKETARSGVPRSRPELRKEAFETQDLHSRDYEDELLRVKITSEERDCCMGENCQGYIHLKDILREVLFESDHQHYLDSNQISPPGRCLRCHRYLTQYLLVNARAECDNSEDVLYSNYYNVVDKKGEYVAEQSHLSSMQHHQASEQISISLIFFFIFQENAFLFSMPFHMLFFLYS